MQLADKVVFVTLKSNAKGSSNIYIYRTEVATIGGNRFLMGQCYLPNIPENDERAYIRDVTVGIALDDIAIAYAMDQSKFDAYFKSYAKENPEKIRPPMLGERY